jgi:hypothetical protein
MPHRDWHLAYEWAAGIVFAGKIDRVEGGIGKAAESNTELRPSRSQPSDSSPLDVTPRLAPLGPSHAISHSSDRRPKLCQAPQAGQKASDQGEARALRGGPRRARQRRWRMLPQASGSPSRTWGAPRTSGSTEPRSSDSDRGMARASSQPPYSFGTQPALPGIRRDNESQHWQAH